LRSFIGEWILSRAPVGAPKANVRAAVGKLGYNLAAPPALIHPARRSDLDEYLQKLVKELGEAINESINNSELVNDALDRIRATGNEVFLVLEATIAFKEKPAERPEEPIPFSDIPVEQRLAEISHEDRQFLKNLKIKFDNEG
jgi:hypothetical protein